MDLNIAEDLFGYGDFEFNAGATSSNGIANGQPDKNAIADFLLGQTYKVQKRLLNSTYMTLRTLGDYAYAQDQWQGQQGVDGQLRPPLERTQSHTALTAASSCSIPLLLHRTWQA